MKPADRIAFIERIARARSWAGLNDAEKNTHRSAAEQIVSELETSYEQTNRLGWIWVTTDDEREPVE